MAEPDWPGDEKDGDDEDIHTHPLVAKLLGSGDPPRDSGVLVGYFGPSKKEGHVRLYLGLDFRDYAEIPASRILYTHPAEPDDEESPTKVLIDGDAELELIHIASATVAASFLQGGIAHAHLESAERGGPAFDGNGPGSPGAGHGGGFFVKTHPPTPWMGPMAGLPTTIFHTPTHTKAPCC